MMYGFCYGGMLVDVSVETAQPGGAADQRLIQPLPSPAWRHECLVVKARLQKATEEIVHTPGIPSHRRPTILAHGFEAVVQGQRRSKSIRFTPRRSNDIDQRTGFLGTARDDATRAVVLETAPHQPLAVGQQRRGQRIAGESLQVPAIKLKLDRSTRIRQQSAADTAGTAFHSASSGGSAMRSSGRPTA